MKRQRTALLDKGGTLIIGFPDQEQAISKTVSMAALVASLLN
jgi:hypothetical protein